MKWKAKQRKHIEKVICKDPNLPPTPIIITIPKPCTTCREKKNGKRKKGIGT